MSDSDIEVHAFDQTNDMIPATGSEQDGALSGTTTAEIEDPTGSRVAAASRGADDTTVTSGGEDDADQRDAGAAATVAAPAAADAGGLAAVDDDDVVAADAADQQRTSAGDRGAERDARPQPATLSEERGDEAGEDYAPTADLPLPGAGAAADADRGEEHTYVVDEDGTATDAGPSEPTYSGAPEVAAWSAGDDGRDEGSTRAESSTTATDDPSHTGRLTDAYDAGPADEVGGSDRPDSLPSLVADDGDEGGTRAESSTAPTEDASHTGRLADAYDAGPADEVGGTDRPDSLPSLVADDADDEGAGHVFDQTNGVIDGLEGDSDGTAASDSRSAGER